MCTMREVFIKNNITFLNKPHNLRNPCTWHKWYGRVCFTLSTLMIALAKSTKINIYLFQCVLVFLLVFHCVFIPDPRTHLNKCSLPAVESRTLRSPREREEREERERERGERERERGEREERGRGREREAREEKRWEERREREGEEREREREREIEAFWKYLLHTFKTTVSIFYSSKIKNHMTLADMFTHTQYHAVIS